MFARLAFACAINVEPDVLIVDEAHCLTVKSGLFNNYGENQIKEIINASKFSVAANLIAGASGV